MGKQQLTARPLAARDLEGYDRLASRFGCLFDTVRWTNAFLPGIRRIGIYDGSALRGGFCVYEQRRFGVRILRNPPFTPQIGPFFERRASNPAAVTNEQRAAVQVMADFLAAEDASIVSVGLSLETTDCLPFTWAGYKAIPRYTYRVDLSQSKEQILSAMSVDRRNDVRKAQTDAVEIEELASASTLRSLVLRTFARKKKAVPVKAMDTILAAFPPGTGSYAAIARHQGRPMAGAYVVHDAKTAYYLMGGYAENAHHGAGPLLVYRAMLRSKELGLQVFDFEGSSVPSIEKYFRGFGGRLTPVFGVHRAILPMEMALKLVRRSLF